jgi:hypothetical protein
MLSKMRQETNRSFDGTHPNSSADDYSVRSDGRTQKKATAAAPPEPQPLLAAPNAGAIVGLLVGHAEQFFAGGFCYARKGHFLLHNG